MKVVRAIALVFSLAGFILCILVATAGTKNFLPKAAITSHQWNQTSDKYDDRKLVVWTSNFYVYECDTSYRLFNNGTTDRFSTDCHKEILQSKAVKRSFKWWAFGTACVGLVILALSVQLARDVHASWSMIAMFPVMISIVSLILGGGGTTEYCTKHTVGGCGKLFLALTWAAVGCMAVPIPIILLGMFKAFYDDCVKVLGGNRGKYESVAV